jgi:hypothetical protein
MVEVYAEGYSVTSQRKSVNAVFFFVFFVTFVVMIGCGQSRATLLAGSNYKLG